MKKYIVIVDEDFVLVNTNGNYHATISSSPAEFFTKEDAECAIADVQCDGYRIKTINK